ncbi:MAG: TIM barrel protein, partial [Candidatus Bathyarchaeia archaeon]
ANPAVVWLLLRDYDPDYLGAYIDPGHMAVEGSRSGWRMGMDLLSQHIRMVAVKDFGWFQERDEKTGQKRWRLDPVPLGDGLVPWPQVFTHLREIGFDGPISVHSEYRNLSLEELIQQTKKDLNYLKNIIREAKEV